MLNHSALYRSIKYDYMNILTWTILKKTQILNGCETFDVRSLNTSFNLVESACNKQNKQVLGLSEIWHPDSKIKDNVKRAWNWFATVRKGERGGGTALMIAKDVKVYER